jgi:endonuclease/exonuclease/phosphatase family metal-dependent hydrolase
MGTHIGLWGSSRGKKVQLLTRANQTCNEEKSPIMVGGDFNIIRGRKEKNNNRYDDR